MTVIILLSILLSIVSLCRGFAVLPMLTVSNRMYAALRFDATYSQSPATKECTSRNFMIEIELDDLKCGESNKLEFSLQPKQNINVNDSNICEDLKDPHNDYEDDDNGGIDVNAIGSYDKWNDTTSNVNERDLWLNLWQKLQYQLTMTLYKAGIKQWEDTRTLYYSPTQQPNHEAEHHSSTTLVKTADDLIAVANCNYHGHIKSGDNNDSAATRIVLKIKVMLDLQCTFYSLLGNYSEWTNHRKKQKKSENSRKFWQNLKKKSRNLECLFCFFVFVACEKTTETQFDRRIGIFKSETCWDYGKK